MEMISILKKSINIVILKTHFYHGIIVLFNKSLCDVPLNVAKLQLMIR